MLRKVYLEGEIAQKYGKVFDMNVSSIRDVFNILQANFEGVRHYLVDCERKGINFSFQVAGKSIDSDQDLILPIEEGDVLVSAVPAGSKSGGGKLFAALAIASLFMIPGAIGAAGASGVLGSTTAAGITTLNIGGNLLAGLAINLAITGLQQLMAPDPSTDTEEPASYLFNGSQQNVVEGDPVPVLYGELRVPGQPINFGVISSTRTYTANNSSNGGGFAAGDTGSGNTGFTSTAED
jgi:predicted phage tail protein